MAGNKYLLTDKSTILKNKLDLLATKLQSTAYSKDLNTQELYILESIKTINEFYKDLMAPTFNPSIIHAGDLPDLTLYNELWQTLLNDLTTIFTEIENVESLAISNFNYMVTRSNRLIARLKSVYSKLGDYILYASNSSKDAIYFKDTFNNLDRIEAGTSLLNSEECSVNQIEGIITLPIDIEKDPFVLIKQVPVINNNSNGNPGNNFMTGQWNGDINVILDNNPDTWFEYEKVINLKALNKEPLILDITINLDIPTIINCVKINPNNFGTKTIINIDTIETSLDGSIYTSVKDDIPLWNFEDEPNTFVLAPATSKYAGQGVYSFTPRKVKYLHLVFSQNEPYVIKDLQGKEQLRYAIGLRDITILSYVYKTTGELISKPYECLDEIRKVMLYTNQNPLTFSELGSLRYYLSPDNGQVWFEIQPKQIEGFSGVVSIPEILDFNGNSSQSIKTSSPVNDIRLKVGINRNDEAFTSSSTTLYKTKARTSELYPVPTTSPYTIKLNRPPVDGSLSVIDPMFGCKGNLRTPYVLGFQSKNSNTRSFDLPFKDIKHPVKKILEDSGIWSTVPVSASEWVHLAVAGKEWNSITKPIEEYEINLNNPVSGVNSLYWFDPVNGVIKFGDGWNTAAPTIGDRIDFWMEPERIFPNDIEDAHKATLEFSTSANKDSLIIKRYDQEMVAIEVLPRNVSTIRLQAQNLNNITNLISTLSDYGYTLQKSFINGRDELINETDWSIEKTSGYIYLEHPTPSNEDITISYTYIPITTLSSEDWDWTSGNTINKELIIKESGWKTISVEKEEILFNDGATVLNLRALGIIPGSLSIKAITSSGTDLNENENPFLKEVNFIDGYSELGKFGRSAKVQPIGQLGYGISTISFESIPVSESILFTNTDIFTTRIADDTLPVSPGQFSIFYTESPVTCKVFSNTIYEKPTVARPRTYQPRSKTANTQNFSVADHPIYTQSFSGDILYTTIGADFIDTGLYSIDYSSGKIYTQRLLDLTWIVQANYSYSDYKAEYQIARELDPKDYSVNLADRTITFSDREIIKKGFFPKENILGGQLNYLVNYEYIAEVREEIENLKDYYTPVLKDYALKVLTKSKVL